MVLQQLDSIAWSKTSLHMQHAAKVTLPTKRSPSSSQLARKDGFASSKSTCELSTSIPFTSVSFTSMYFTFVFPASSCTSVSVDCDSESDVLFFFDGRPPRPNSLQKSQESLE